MDRTVPGEQITLLNLTGAEPSRGLGMLEISRPVGKVRLPLLGVKIAAKVADRVAAVTVEERFTNSYPDHLEAVYIFPLSPGCAVSRFELKVGERVVKGVVQERGEARQQYQTALDNGKRAALLEQERDDVFTVHLGNLPPGEEITVLLAYSERLPYFEDGKTEIRLPLVVAPRYIPGSPLEADAVGDGVECDTDLVADASRITPPRLVPGFDPKVALELFVELRADNGALQDLECSQHATKIGIGRDAIKVELSRTDERLDRDFVLCWRLVSDSIKSQLLVHRVEDGKAYGMLTVLPPKRDGYLGAARDVVFVVDRSGSMRGVKMASAARACSVLLATLGPSDRFAIQAFDDSCEWLQAPLARGVGPAELFHWADEAGCERGNQYLRKIDARGGTEMDAALAGVFQAIAGRSSKDGRVPVVVLLTDGEVGDESRILRRIQTELGEARLFAIGIDTAVNNGLLKRVANLGGGTATFVAPGTQLEDALLAVGREIGNPLLVDLQLDAAGGKLDRLSVAPERIGDLYAGRAVTVFFKFTGKAKFKVKGRFTDGRKFEEAIDGQDVDLGAISQLWAKTYVADLEDRCRIQPLKREELQARIVETAVEHSLLTRFTAFVVVDEAEVVNADGLARKFVQPVEYPADWQDADQWAVASGQFYGAPMPGQPTEAAGSWGGAPSVPDVLFNRANAFSDFTEVQAQSTAEQSSRARMERSAEAPQPSCAPASCPPPDSGYFKESRPDLSALRGSGADRQNAIKEAMAALVSAIELALRELKAGRIPAVEPIDLARNELLSELATDDVGTQVPVLQKFLRGSAVEMVAALKEVAAKPDRVLRLFESHNKLFKEAQNELKGALAGKSSGTGKRFWELNI